MTTETITFGYVLIAASILILVGAFIGWGGKDWWDERTARKAVRIVSTPHVQQELAVAPIADHHHWREVVDDERIICMHLGGRPRPEALDYLCTRPMNHGGEHWARRRDGSRITTWLDDTADVQRRLASVAPVVPMQRNGGAS